MEINHDFYKITQTKQNRLGCRSGNQHEININEKRGELTYKKQRDCVSASSLDAALLHASAEPSGQDRTLE